MTKYSIKNICLGIGIGLIIASVANINTTPMQFTREDIEREAKKLNLIVMDAKDLISKQTPMIQPEPSKPKQTITINIETGETSQSIAKKLLTNNLIQSEQAFVDKLDEQKKASKLQIGEFKIQVGTTIEEIINIITSAPK